MNRTLRIIFVTLLLAASATAQVRRHDPLTDEEVDQLREYTQEPELRIKLLVQFTRERLATLDQPLKATDAAGRGREIHDHLEDFVALYDEIEDNVTMYVEHKEDVRKPLRLLIAADEEFAARFRHMREQLDDPKATAATRAEASEYTFVLANASEAVGSALGDHRKLLEEQEAAAREKKKRK